MARKQRKLNALLRDLDPETGKLLPVAVLGSRPLRTFHKVNSDQVLDVTNGGETLLNFDEEVLNDGGIVTSDADEEIPWTLTVPADAPAGSMVDINVQVCVVANGDGVTNVRLGLYVVKNGTEYIFNSFVNSMASVAVDLVAGVYYNNALSGKIPVEAGDVLTISMYSESNANLDEGEQVVSKDLGIYGTIGVQAMLHY